MIDRSSPSVCLAAPRSRLAAVVAGLCLAIGLPSVAGSTEGGSGAARSWFERSFVAAADRKCRLFDPALGAALEASALQARGAAARAGETSEQLAQGLAQAEALAAATACDHPDLAVVRERAVSAYGAWTGLRRMDFPGARSAWKADRTRRDADAWRLSQTGGIGGARATMGLLARVDGADDLAVAVAFPGQARPYAARITLRDAERVNLPWLKDGGAALPPHWTTTSVMAASNAPTELALTGALKGDGRLWVFPASAGDALARLDPRETFVVEFLFRDDSVARVRFEVGDFAAGRAFAALGPL